MPEYYPGFSFRESNNIHHCLTKAIGSVGDRRVCCTFASVFANKMGIFVLVIRDWLDHCT